MKLFRALGRVAKPFVNFPQWMGATELVRHAREIKVLATTAVSVPRSGRQETFEQAVVRLGLSDTALTKRQQEFFWLACLFCGIGFIVLGYLTYHLFHAHWMAALVSAVLASVAFAMAFRNHFWYVQMRHRRLGLHWQEWIKLLLGKQA